MFNQEVLEKISSTKSKLLLVTKYFDAAKTREILAEIKKEPCFLALGENRIDDIITKKLPRESVHFIGNIQSRRISEITEHCSVVHSLCDLKHAKLFAKQAQQCRFFIQINVSEETEKQGILPEDFAGFYESLPKELEIIGVSGMGRGKGFSLFKKIAEFETLVKIRDKFNKDWKVSAGTSVDYDIAVDMKAGRGAFVDIVRVGTAIFE